MARIQIALELTKEYIVQEEEVSMAPEESYMSKYNDNDDYDKDWINWRAKNTGWIGGYD